MSGRRQILIEKGGSRRAPKGTFRSAYDTVTAPENRAFVRSIALFGASVAILASSWSEILLPPQ